MFCSIYKWLISRSEDLGKPMSGHAARHLRRCATCREYAEFCESLKNRSAQDIPGLLNNYNGAFNEKIISALSKHPEPKPGKGRNPILIPVLTAASVLLVISISILWLAGPSSNKIPQLNQLSELGFSRTSVENMLVKVDSPFDQEIVELKKTLESTANFLLSRIDIEIGEETD